MKWKSIILAFAIILGIWCFSMDNVQAQTLQLAGPTKVGDLYVDTQKTSAVKKDGVYYLTVFAEEKYTNKVFLGSLHKNERLKDVVGAVYLFLFDNRGSSYCTATKCLVDSEGKVCLDYGSDMRMKRLTANDTAMLNAYTLCLKSLENKQRVQKGFIK